MLTDSAITLIEFALFIGALGFGAWLTERRPR